MTAVIFDAGKVLLDFDYEPVRVALAARSEKELPELHDVSLEQAFDNLHTGKISCTQFWVFFRKTFGYSGTFTEFEQDICCSFKIIPRGVEVLKEMLALDSVQVALLSDNHHICTRWIAREIPEVFDADVVILSQEVGVVKPDPAIYKYTLEKLGEEPEQCFFIDDRANNIEAAQIAGIKTVQHKSWEESYPELISFLKEQEG